jgi:hypothetical protein
MNFEIVPKVSTNVFFRFSYEKALVESRRLGIRKAAIMGIGIGLTMLIMYSSYALAFW